MPPTETYLADYDGQTGDATALRRHRRRRGLAQTARARPPPTLRRRGRRRDDAGHNHGCRRDARNPNARRLQSRPRRAARSSAARTRRPAAPPAA
ncbi:MAG: hypothetical protein WDM84_05920 [Bauldia sp.]